MPLILHVVIVPAQSVIWMVNDEHMPPTHRNYPITRPPHRPGRDDPHALLPAAASPSAIFICPRLTLSFAIANPHSRSHPTTRTASLSPARAFLQSLLLLSAEHLALSTSL